MVRCAPGDKVICQIKDNIIVNIYSDGWDDRRIFEIVSLYEEGYLIHIPIDLFIKDCITISKENFKKFNLDKKFIGIESYYITDHKIISVHSKLDGMCCSKCEQFCSMAEPNQLDGKTFICWSCRRYPLYR